MIAKRGLKKIRYRGTGKKDQITVLGCANAVGGALYHLWSFLNDTMHHQAIHRSTNEIHGTFAHTDTNSGMKCSRYLVAHTNTKLGEAP